MIKHHEVPTHLNVEDKVLFGLTVRQFLHILVGSSSGYTFWQQATMLREDVRAVVVVASMLMSLAFALVRPADRPLEEWLVAALVYAGSARRATWRPAEPASATWRPATGGWQELTPSLSWAEEDEVSAA